MTSNPQLRAIFAACFLLVAAWFVIDPGLGQGPLTAQVFDGEGLIGGRDAAEQELSGSGIRDDVDFIESIAAVINFALTFAGIFAFVAFIVAGFIFILGFGSDSANQRAKKIMIWAAVGLVVIIFSFVLVQFIVDVTTANSTAT